MTSGARQRCRVAAWCNDAKRLGCGCRPCPAPGSATARLPRRCGRWSKPPPLPRCPIFQPSFPALSWAFGGCARPARRAACTPRLPWGPLRLCTPRSLRPHGESILALRAGRVLWRDQQQQQRCVWPRRQIGVCCIPGERGRVEHQDRQPGKLSRARPRSRQPPAGQRARIPAHAPRAPQQPPRHTPSLCPRLPAQAQVLSPSTASTSDAPASVAAPEVTCLARAPGGRQLAAGYADGSVRLWDLTSGDCSVALKGHKVRPAWTATANQPDACLPAAACVTALHDDTTFPSSNRIHSVECPCVAELKPPTNSPPCVRRWHSGPAVPGHALLAHLLACAGPGRPA